MPTESTLWELSICGRGQGRIWSIVAIRDSSTLTRNGWVSSSRWDWSLHQRSLPMNSSHRTGDFAQRQRGFSRIYMEESGEGVAVRQRVRDLKDLFVSWLDWEDDGFCKTRMPIADQLEISLPELTCCTVGHVGSSESCRVRKPTG